MPQPLLYETNTRVLLTEQGARLRRPATLDDVPDALLDRWARLGFDWVWLMGVWQTGPAGRHVSLTVPDLVRGHADDLPGWRPEDVCGSPFAVQRYVVHPDFGGDAALARLRSRLADRGLRLMLDFVPNHVALDHPWTTTRPEYFVEGTEALRTLAPGNWAVVEAAGRRRLLAHGRDPSFGGWADTLQLDYRRPELRAVQRQVLAGIAQRADGVRCDMAMLLLPEVFRRTWGTLPDVPPYDESFWPEAIAAVKREHPGFTFLAEVYWDLEATLQHQGFDFTYDKRLYDHLRTGDAAAVRGHLRSAPDTQARSCRFLENHDESRAAAAFGADRQQAATVLGLTLPGMRLIHDGQLEGRRRHASVHLARRADEPPDRRQTAFHERLLALLRRPELREGRWRPVDVAPAGPTDGTHEGLVAGVWDGPGGSRILIVANLAPGPGRGVFPFPFRSDGAAVLPGLLAGSAAAAPKGEGRGLELPAWGFCVLDVGGIR